MKYRQEIKAAPNLFGISGAVIACWSFLVVQIEPPTWYWWLCSLVLMLAALGVIASLTPTIRIAYDEQRFEVIREWLRWRRTATYRWEDITQTEYYPRKHVSKGGDGELQQFSTPSFRVFTANGKILDTAPADGLDRLIEAFNRRCPHLGYEWVVNNSADVDDEPYVKKYR